MTYVLLTEWIHRLSYNITYQPKTGIPYYSRKFLWGSIFADGRSLPFHMSNLNVHTPVMYRTIYTDM